MIEFNDYILAYNQTEDIYKLIKNNGYQLIEDLERIIADLKDKWTGSDAPQHINNLIEVRKKMKLYFNDSIFMVKEVSDRVVDIQEAVQQITGAITPGERLEAKFAESVNYDEKENSKSYKAESLKDDYALLSQICENFISFKIAYVQGFEEFFNNWKNDPKKEKTEETFNNFIENLDSYQETLNQIRKALGKVATNIENIL